MKEIEKGTNKWKAALCSWIRRVNVFKVSTLPNNFFTEVEQRILKFILNHKDYCKSSSQKNKAREQRTKFSRRTSHFLFSTYYKATLIKTV